MAAGGEVEGEVARVPYQSTMWLSACSRDGRPPLPECGAPMPAGRVELLRLRPASSFRAGRPPPPVRGAPAAGRPPPPGPRVPTADSGGGAGGGEKGGEGQWGKREAALRVF